MDSKHVSFPSPPSLFDDQHILKDALAALKAQDLQLAVELLSRVSRSWFPGETG